MRVYYFILVWMEDNGITIQENGRFIFEALLRSDLLLEVIAAHFLPQGLVRPFKRLYSDFELVSALFRSLCKLSDEYAPLLGPALLHQVHDLSVKSAGFGGAHGLHTPHAVSAYGVRDVSAPPAHEALLLSGRRLRPGRLIGEN